MTPLKDLILVGGPKEKISPMFLLCLYESCSRNWSKASFPVCVTRPLLMNTVFSLNENISCFCLLLTPPIPTSCLIKINAIYEVELLVAFFKITLGIVRWGPKKMVHITEALCWICPGENSDPAGFLDKQFQLWNPWILTCQDTWTSVARYEKLSWWCSFCDSMYVAFKVYIMFLVICMCQEKLLPL